MRKVILFMIFMVPLILYGQAEKFLIKSLEDKIFAFIDQSILNTSDTNKKNKIMQPHGVWRIRNNSNKALLSVISYSNGKMHGHVISFYPSGLIAHSNYYDMDVLQGPSISYWQNGSPKSYIFYQDGIAEGVIRIFDTLGKLNRLTEFKGGLKEGSEIVFYPNGNIQLSTQYLRDKEHGIRREYLNDDNAQIVAEYEMKNGIKTVGRFYEKGSLMRTENYN